MSPVFTETLGWIAAVITMFIFVPQAYSTIKSKSTEGLSIISYSVMTFGTHMWIMMGALTATLQAMMTNLAIGLLLYPMMYYFISDKKKLYSLYIVMTTSIVAAFVLYIVKPFDSIPSMVDLFVTIFAGASTGFAFAPQTFKVIKTKNTGSISMGTTAIIIIANVLWVVFWILTYLDDSRLSYAFAIFFSCMSAATQVPVMTIMLMNIKSKNKTA